MKFFKCIAFILFPLVLLTSCHKKQKIEKTPLKVHATCAITQDTPIFYSYVGHIQAYAQVSVTAQVEGVLTGCYFTQGGEVKKGDLLFTIDSRPYEAQLSKAEAALALSVANLRYAEDVARRNSKLAQEDFVSQVQYDEYITNVLTNQAEIKESEAEIDTAKINISYCNIHSPIDAVTGNLKLDVGNLVKNADNENPLILLNQIIPIYAYFSVPQKDLPEIMEAHRKCPLKVDVFLNSDEHRSFEGLLDLIDNQIDSKTGSLWLRGIFPNEEKMLWPGEFVNVHLIIKIEPNAVLIPTEAISLGQKGKYVFIVKEDNTVELRYVKTGQRLGNLTLIEEGVQKNDLVITEGQMSLSPGESVQVQNSGAKT